MANQQNTQKENKDSMTSATGASETEGTNKTGTVSKLGSTPAAQSGVQSNAAKDSMSNAGKDSTISAGKDSSSSSAKDSMSGTGAGTKNTAGKPDESKTSDSANQMASQVSEVLRGNTDAAKNIISQAKESTGNLASQAIGQVQEKATTEIDKQKTNLAQGLGSVADSIRQMGESLKGSEQQSGVVALTAQYGDSLAQQVEQFSDYLEKHNIGELMRDVERFARRNPAVFIGGAVVLGFLGARFLKSSNTHQQLMPVERHNQGESNRMKNTGHQTTAGQNFSAESKDKTTTGGGTSNANLTGSNRPL